MIVVGRLSGDLIDALDVLMGVTFNNLQSRSIDFILAGFFRFTRLLTALTIIILCKKDPYLFRWIVRAIILFQTVPNRTLFFLNDRKTIWSQLSWLFMHEKKYRREDDWEWLLYGTVYEAVSRTESLLFQVGWIGDYVPAKIFLVGCRSRD